MSIAVIDIGTLLVHSALAAQESRVRVTNKQSGKSAEFKNITEFWGHHSKKDGGVLAKVNDKRKGEGISPLLVPEDFDVETIISLISDENVSPESIACGRLKNKIESITSQPWCTDFIICHGVGENYRYSEAHTQPYKAERPEKPLMMDVVKEYMLKKYKKNLFIVENAEDDDACTQLLWESWIRTKRNHNKLDSVGVFIDKDLRQTPCLQYNFDKPELGLIKIDRITAAKSLAIQLLRGDATDTIPGLRELHPELFKRYGLRRTKGIGEKTAEGVFRDTEDIQEIYRRVVEAYQMCYGEEKKEFISFRGKVFQWNWLDHLNEQFQLLRMRTDVTKPVGHVSEFLSKVGVKYE